MRSLLDEVLDGRDINYVEFPNAVVFVKDPGSTIKKRGLIGYETKVIKGNFDLTFLYDFYDEDELFYSIEKLDMKRK